MGPRLESWFCSAYVCCFLLSASRCQSGSNYAGRCLQLEALKATSGTDVFTWVEGWLKRSRFLNCCIACGLPLVTRDDDSASRISGLLPVAAFACGKKFL